MSRTLRVEISRIAEVVDIVVKCGSNVNFWNETIGPNRSSPSPCKGFDPIWMDIGEQIPSVAEKLYHLLNQEL
jgi:hypothetical protein